jgi:hypothetical protein
MQEKQKQESVFMVTSYTFVEHQSPGNPSLVRLLPYLQLRLNTLQCQKSQKEVIAVKNWLESIGVKLHYPIEIPDNNVGALYLANNHTTSQRTKQIDTRQHFVQEWVEDVILKILFTKSGDNQSDIFTKNPTEEVFSKHSTEIVSEKEDYDKAGDKINYAFISQQKPEIIYGGDPYIEHLQKWEAEYLILKKPNGNFIDIKEATDLI